MNHPLATPETSAPRGPSPTKPPPGRNGFKYRPRFGVVVLCDDEQHQASVYETLRLQGHKLRVVAV